MPAGTVTLNEPPPLLDPSDDEAGEGAYTLFQPLDTPLTLQAIEEAKRKAGLGYPTALWHERNGGNTHQPQEACATSSTSLAEAFAPAGLQEAPESALLEAERGELGSSELAGSGKSIEVDVSVPPATPEQRSPALQAAPAAHTDNAVGNTQRSSSCPGPNQQAIHGGSRKGANGQDGQRDHGCSTRLRKPLMQSLRILSS